MPKIITVPSSDYQWTTISSKELEDKKYQIALMMAWDLFAKELEKSGVVFDSKSTLKELGQEFNEFIQESKANYKKEANSILELDIFKNYNKNLKALLQKTTEKVEYKDLIDEEIYKLHVNLPLEKRRDITIKIAKDVFEYLKKLIAEEKIHSAKAYAGLVEGTIDENDLQNRYLNAAQITIYLPKNIDPDSITEIVSNINKIAANQGVAHMESASGDSLLGNGVVSLRCDFCNGQYVAYDKMSKEHFAQQETLSVVKQFREQKTKQVAADTQPSTSIFIKKKQRPALQRTKAVRDFKDFNLKK